jgi:hypothetical protein
VLLNSQVFARLPVSISGGRLNSEKLWWLRVSRVTTSSTLDDDDDDVIVA